MPLLSLLLFAGCPETVENPTGDCVAETDGSRVCYAYPADTDVYLPDCEAPLAREYWRVFAQDTESAYVFPRPDGSTAVAELCAGDDADTVALLDRYTLCHDTDVAVVNDMAIADALAITHLLHERLRFVAEGSWIDPYLPTDDILAICAESTDTTLADWCAFEEGRISGDTCEEIAYEPSEAEATAMAAAANTIYGIE